MTAWNAFLFPKAIRFGDERDVWLGEENVWNWI